MMMFMQQIMATAQINPSILQGMDIIEFMKQIAEELSLDIHKIFPPTATAAQQIDEIDAAHDQIAMGIVPQIPDGGDLMMRYMKAVSWEKTSIFKQLGKQAKDAMSKYKQLILQKIQKQMINPQINESQTKSFNPQLQSGGGSRTPQAVQQQSVQGMAIPLEGQTGPSGAAVSPQAFARGVRAGMGVS
jgi:hypothetical protein